MDESELVIYKTADGSIQSGGFRVALPLRSEEELQQSGGSRNHTPFLFPAGLYVQDKHISSLNEMRMEVPVFHEELGDDIYDMLYRLVYIPTNKRPGFIKGKTRKKGKGG